MARGTDGICTAQPSVNREIVPVQQPPRVVRKAHVFDEVADAWREILEVVSMPVSEPDTPHTPPPDFMPRKEMSSKACDIKFLNFDTWKQHQIVVHDMSIKDWTLVYEQRDALKRNRAQKRYALCLSKAAHIQEVVGQRAITYRHYLCQPYRG